MASTEGVWIQLKERKVCGSGASRRKEDGIKSTIEASIEET